MSEISDTKQQNDARELAIKIAEFLDGRKAKDVKILHVSDQTIIADYFVIAEGTSTTHVNSLAEETDFKLSQEGIKPQRTEGAHSGTWILLDYSSVIVHVFLSSQRDFYKLEKLWADGEEIPFNKVED